MKHLLPGAVIVLLAIAFAMGFYFGRATAKLHGIVVEHRYGDVRKKYLIDPDTGDTIKYLGTDVHE